MAYEDGDVVSGVQVNLDSALEKAAESVAGTYRYHDPANIVTQEGLSSLLSGIANDLFHQGYRLVELSEEDKLIEWGNT